MKLRRNKSGLFLTALRSFKSLFLCTLFILTTCIFFISDSVAKSKTPKVPFIGEVTTNSLNVRAGQSANFEKLVQLKKGDTVLVVDAQYSWYKIRLPKAAKIYISKKYLQELTGKKAIVLGDKVNIRSGPDVKYSIIGQLKRGDSVEVVATKDDWYQILPWDESYGWVLEDFVKFKTHDTVTASLSNGSIDGQDKGVQDPKENAKELKATVSESDMFIRLKGEIVKLPLQENIPVQVTHMLKGADKEYYLSAPDDILSEFLNRKVKIEGKIKNQNTIDGTPALINVTKIELIL